MKKAMYRSLSMIDFLKGIINYLTKQRYDIIIIVIINMFRYIKRIDRQINDTLNVYTELGKMSMPFFKYVCC